MKMSTETKELFAALSKAQADIRGAVKDSANPFFKSKYADLESVWEACRSALTKNGLSVTQTTDYIPDAGTCVVTVLGHSSGQWIAGTLPVMAAKQDPQGMGSAITYARRYALAAIAGVVQVDDDGEAAMGRETVQYSGPSPLPKGPKFGVMPGRPDVGDGYAPKEYRGVFGKYRNKGLPEFEREHGLEKIAADIDDIPRWLKDKGKPVTPDIQEQLERMEKYVAMRENEMAKELKGEPTDGFNGAV